MTKTKTPKRKSPNRITKIAALTKEQALELVRKDWSQFEQDLSWYEDLLPLDTKCDCEASNKELEVSEK